MPLRSGDFRFHNVFGRRIHRTQHKHTTNTTQIQFVKHNTTQTHYCRAFCLAGVVLVWCCVCVCVCVVFVLCLCCVWCCGMVLLCFWSVTVLCFVLGSRSAILCADALEAAPVCIHAGANVSDRCVLLPGCTIGRNAVLGSGISHMLYV